MLKFAFLGVYTYTPYQHINGFTLNQALFHNNASPTSMIVSSFLGPPWPARPNHLHSFVLRLTKETSPWS